MQESKINTNKIESNSENHDINTTIIEGNNDIIKNIETEQFIYSQLLNFERKHYYNKKGISAAKMSVMLKTNTKYLSYILKKYRENDFYTYINICRINYIVNELNNNPKLRHYKVSVLSEMCGFSSHSQFASVFKSIKGISPSQYINLLLKEKSK